MIKNILVTGGAGYIGSHLYISLIENNYNPIILDNFIGSHKNVIKNISELIGQNINIINGDACNKNTVKEIILDYKVSSVIHLAAHKSVEESMKHPTMYYDNNIGSILGVLSAMSESDCKKIIFSSSACVYGDSPKSPIQEDSNRVYSNPYAHTKIISEDIIKYISHKNANMRYAILRYFNPAGAHKSGIIGEHINENSKNLFPIISKVINGDLDRIEIYGSDYDTNDGTPIRDFIHIEDLVEGHVEALSYLFNQNKNIVVNLGTGTGITVLETIKTYESYLGKKINYIFKDRRSGDASVNYADANLAKKLLKWSTKRDIIDICKSSILWNKNYPNGYS